ncbi:PREDICTED: uncharacterized protein LOC106114625 [Papilio xuthus]|uniref:Uncharacterized protein LOC106114625 n=1 Tax=Papilio xuthus TaxID=66420 RepID=A0AAJ6Z1R4_PAPXU|nr:PREDICTED: uncharacterized protein LOC106114625 [Papilio xuthus]XP_013163353.1 PREDICTED: uncharacterized protein LOC106114625 [Papilio xuthus]XP_013163354.1 PREDICTED: uncharacterized protein LOC106114625 [Papilio xuthus]
MQKSDRYTEDKDPEGGKSRPTSRRNSACLSRRGSREEKESKRVTTAPTSSNSTPKRQPKSQNFDLVVTGRQIFKRADRASSLPGSHRRPSLDSLPKKRTFDSPKRHSMAHSARSRDTIEDDMSLELSQVSDFEDMNSKYGIKRITATSTPKPQKPRSGSLQCQITRGPRDVTVRRGQMSLDSRCSRQSTISCSKDSYKTSSSSQYRQGVSTELDCSSVSPEYSAPSSVGSMGVAPDTLMSPRSQDLNESSCCVSTWQESGRVGPAEGEWAHFWARYNGPTSALYDHCPTPYRSDDLDLLDFEFSTDGSVKRSPDKSINIHDLIKQEGLHLTAKETQNIIKCAQILGSVVSKAIDRRTKDDVTEKIQEIKEPEEKEIKKKTLTLDLKETVLPVEVKEEKRWETVTTQTDISLPNTKSAPKIFEKILRQLSKSSLDESLDKKMEQNVKEDKDQNKPGS